MIINIINDRQKGGQIVPFYIEGMKAMKNQGVSANLPVQMTSRYAVDVKFCD
jgi:hypothetical protein